MSDYHGIIPEPRPISFEQDQKGVGRLVMSIPMVFQKDNSGAWIPMPTKYPSVAGYSFAGARGREAAGETSGAVTIGAMLHDQLATERKALETALSSKVLLEKIERKIGGTAKYG
jgi:hypothetical protein